MSHFPILLNNYNRLGTTRKMVSDLQALGYSNVVVLDNGSTYKPLLEWYGQSGVQVLFLHHNHGSQALWSREVQQAYGHYPFVAYSDADLELNERTPRDFIQQLLDYRQKWRVPKAGLALKIDDLPDTTYGAFAKGWEPQFWGREVEKNVYRADVDTTFFVAPPTQPFQYEAVRVAGDFTARHVPWYVDFNQLDEEEQYFLDHSSNVSTYKRYYLTHKGIR